MLAFSRTLITASWLVLFAYFAWAGWRAHAGRSGPARRTDPKFLAGMALELAALILVPLFRVEDPGLPAAVYAAATALALAAAAFAIMAGLHLGKQLRVEAAVSDDQRLIISGPYSVLRHPMYASLFGMTVASALSFSDTRVLFAVMPIFIVGTEIRVRTEDRLLAAHFGGQFDDYRRRVRAYLPGIR